MSDGHLTDEELAEVLAGEPSPRVSAHLAACPRCADEASALSGTVRAARSRVVAFPVTSLGTRRVSAATFGAAALLAATLVLGVSGVLRKADSPARPVSAAAPNDEALLEALENAEARSAPAPLASALPERERLSPERRTSPR
ncbi:MAG: hypothetical protein JNK60_20695 [Acidobacteria bacterium]|nr:hypothetical protein [Acidobacteriota bacterium]